MESVVENFSVVDSMPIIAEEPEEEEATHMITSSSAAPTETHTITSVTIPSITDNHTITSNTLPTITSDALPIITSSHTIPTITSDTITSDAIPAITATHTIVTTTHKITADTLNPNSIPIITRVHNGTNHESTEMLDEKPHVEVLTEGMNESDIVGDEMTQGDGMTQIFSSDTGQIITTEHQLIDAEHHIFSEGEIIPDDSSSHIIMNADGTSNILHAGGQIMGETVKAHILSADGEMITVDSNLLHEAHGIPQHVTEVTEDVCMDEEEEEVDYQDQLLQTIKKEPMDEDSEAATIQIRVNASAPRKREPPHSPPDSSKEDGDLGGKDDSGSKYTRVDRDDPRCRLHFVKYMKRDGKTIKIWECGICGKEFMHQYTLMRHLPTHTDERNFRCNQCGKAFRQMSTLSQHKATHSESRPYVCDVCQKTFSRVSTLISHKKTHTDSKQHRCDVCGKAFHQKGNLKNHYFTHTNERPYKCEICGRGFNQSSNLQCHKAKSHADGSIGYQYAGDKYKCNFCDQAFPRRSQLRQHEEYKHLLRTIRGGNRGSGGGGNNAVLKKRKIGNVRIIQLANGDRTFQEIGSNDTISRQRRIRPRGTWKQGILIEPIDTKAMHRALAAGQTPFALLKPSKGVPVVVKVQCALGSKHMLVPATANELRNAGKFTVSSHQSGTKAVQIKVPVVATVLQRIDEDGQMHMDIEAPADDDEEETENNGIEIETGITRKQEVEMKSPESPTITAVEDNLATSQPLVINPVVQTSIREPVLGHEEDATRVNLVAGEGVVGEEEGSMIIGAMEEEEGGETIDFPIHHHHQPVAGEENGEEGINSVDLLATAVNLVSQAHMTKEGMVSMDGVQYLRQVNLGEYEVVPPDHAQATHIMNQHGHIQQIKMVEDEAQTVTMEQANITALMDALQSAGYHLGTGNQQIIINADGNAMVVDQQVQMVINGDMEGVISAKGWSVIPSILPPSIWSSMRSQRGYSRAVVKIRHEDNGGSTVCFIERPGCTRNILYLVQWNRVNLDISLIKSN